MYESVKGRINIVVYIKYSETYYFTPNDPKPTERRPKTTVLVANIMRDTKERKPSTTQQPYYTQYYISISNLISIILKGTEPKKRYDISNQRYSTKEGRKVN